MVVAFYLTITEPGPVIIERDMTEHPKLGNSRNVPEHNVPRPFFSNEITKQYVGPSIYNLFFVFFETLINYYLAIVLYLCFRLNRRRFDRFRRVQTPDVPEDEGDGRRR